MITAIYNAFVPNLDFKTEFTADDKHPRMSAFNKVKGVSVLAWKHSDQHGRSVSIATVKLRTRGSGYRSLLRIFLQSQTDIQKVVSKAVEALAYKPLDLNELPPPWLFHDPRFNVEEKRPGWYGRTGGPFVTCHSVIHGVEVIKIVTIGRDAVVSDLSIHDPDQTCWYLLDCVGHTGATFNVISDGEVFYPTNRVTQSTKTVRLAETSGKATVDLKKAGVADKELVNAAIEAWVARLLTAEALPAPVV